MGSYFSNSSADSPIAMKKRPDLLIRPMVFQGETHWVCKEPLGQEYKHLNEHEYAILNWLDGEATFDDLKNRFERKFTPYRAELREIAQCIGMLHENSLVTASDNLQGSKLLEMRREKDRQELKQKLTSIHAIKSKGFDPERFLNLTNPYVTWFFSKPMVITVLVMALLAAMWLMLHFEQVAARAPSLWSFLDPSNWMTLGLVVAGTKLVHEFGHAYTFKRFGGEVHEIGVMIFFFMPTMYCNTSDSWLLRDKWQRIAVGAGGIYMEIFMFSVATFVWWFSTGALQSFAINTMFICSLSTVLINCNPLLKYDGYFMLTDLIEMPNLAKHGSEQVRRKFMVHCMGDRDQESLWESDHNKRIMLFYGVASYLFKLVLISTVAYMMVGNFSSVGLAVVGFWCAAAIAVFYLSMPIYKLGKDLKTPGTMLKTKRKNIVVTCFCTLLLLAVLFIPFRYSINSDCTMGSETAVPIHCMEAGKLEKALIRPGAFVKQGDLIAVLGNEELEMEYGHVKMDLDMVVEKIEETQFDLFRNDVELMPKVLQAELVRLKTMASEMEKQLASLELRAPCDGILVGVNLDPSKENKNDTRILEQTKGNLLLADSVGSWIEADTEICRVQPLQDFRASLTIKLQDADLVEEGQTVRMLFNSDRSDFYESHISELSAKPETSDDLIDFQSVGRAVVEANNLKKQQGDKIVNTDGGSFHSHFLLAVCPVEMESSTVTFGTTGVAKIEVGSYSVAWRLLRQYRLFINSKL